MTISYVHPRRTATAPATAPADTGTGQDTGSVRLRPGQSVNLTELGAQRAQDTHRDGLRERRTRI